MDQFAQSKKNTVSAKEQLKVSQFVRYINADGKGRRVMFVGNSITLHGVKEDIGWYGEWGMAASAPEKDYVHLMMNEITRTDPDAAFCVCQAAQWEINCADGEKTYDYFKTARDFDADIILIRLVENCPHSGVDTETYTREYLKFIDYLNPNGKAKMVITTGFWRHPHDASIRAAAKERAYTLVELGDLGEQDEMKAIGLFDHTGVANHPGDKGMKAIADRLLEMLRSII
ncbi:MAG: SGNH/GDSL hydrolase family protein [Ruminococcaceae bacterium]|nr:SGNH/GDSL hydrolase family protein [Oscillospiraceae bacterium]